MSSTLDPEDMSHFDIDKEVDIKDIFKKEDLPSRRQLLLFFITLVLFVVGHFLAPVPIDPGTYDIELQYNQDGISFQIDVSNGLEKAQGFTTISSTHNDFLLNASYYQQYPASSGTTLVFYLKVVPNQQLDLEANDFSGSITNQALEHDFIAKQVEDSEAIFEFKILKNTRIALGLLFAVSFLWLSELVPLAASSLIIPVVLVFLDIETATRALVDFAQPIIFLFLAGFLMAEAMQRSKLDLFISYRIFSNIPANDKLLVLALMSLAAGFSMFMSNTAASAILIPLAIQLLKGVELDNAKYRQTVVLGIAYASTVGGIGSLIGTPPNIIASELLRQFDPTIEITFAEWFFFGLPVVIIMVPIVFAYLWFRFRPEIDKEKLETAKMQAKIHVAEEHNLTLDQLVVSGIFVVIFGLWLTSNLHGISAGIVALFGAILLFFSGQIKESDLNEINWNALLTFGGGLTLGRLIINTGLADFIGSKAKAISGLPVLLILLTIATLALFLTAFASNTASAVILIPIVMPLSYVLGISPIVLAVVVAIAASIDFAIVIGTPPTMVAYSTGIFKTSEIFKIGIVLDFVGLIVVTLLSWLLFINFAGLV